MSTAYPIANKTILSTSIENTALFNEVYELEYGYLHAVAWHVRFLYNSSLVHHNGEFTARVALCVLDLIVSGRKDG